MSSSRATEVAFLVLGAGWLSQFLLPLLSSHKITNAATTTTGRDGTIKFVFDPDSENSEPYRQLPRAQTVLITFPIKGKASCKRLLDFYAQTHPSNSTNWILLGSTGVWQGGGWFDHQSEITSRGERVEAEEQMLDMQGCVMNLAGLWGEPDRDGKKWDRAVPKTKEELGEKGTVHFINGRDVARGVIAVSEKFTSERWLVSDGRVYDWWDLVWGEEDVERLDGRLGEGERYRRWLLELMEEKGFRALPREGLTGRKLDTRAFWKWIGIEPDGGRFKMPPQDIASPKTNL